MMFKRIEPVWVRIPAIVRAPILGYAVFAIGSFAAVLPLFGNLQYYPDIPWAFPVTLLILWIYWWFFTGGGIPKTTRETRQRFGRRRTISAKAWPAAIMAIVSIVTTMLAMRMAMPFVMHVAPAQIGIDLSEYPMATVVGLILSVAATAAVVEEVGFRGYMQAPLERAYGIIPALILVGVVFWIAHQNHAELTYTHLPFHMLASVFLGAMVYITRSLTPAIIAHFLADIALQPIYLLKSPGFLYALVESKPVWAAASNAETANFQDKVSIIWNVLTTTPISEASPERGFVLISILFAVGLIFSAWSLFNLATASSNNRQI